MKKGIGILILAIIIWGCSMSPSTETSAIEFAEIEYTTEKVVFEEISVVQDTVKVVPAKLELDGDKKKKEQQKVKELNKAYDEREEKVIEQIQTLDDQQILLDSLIRNKMKKDSVENAQNR